MTTVIGILAAGASARMRGRDKLIEDIDGEPLLARQIRVADAIGCPVLVALPPEPDARRRIVARTAARPVPVEDAARGMGASIAALARVAAALGADRLMLVLADMPELAAPDLQALVDRARAEPGAVVRAGTSAGRPGHPVVFPARLFDDLARLDDDEGAREVVARSGGARIVPLPGDRAVTDLDTPEAWAEWRRRRGK